MIVTIFTLCATLAFTAAKIPSNWLVCKNVPDQNECLNKAVQFAIKDLLNGNPSLGVPSLDPFRVNYMAIGDKSNGPVSIRAELLDSDIIGVKNINISNLKTDWKTITYDYFTPTLESKGRIKANGKILVLPFTGDGNYALKFDNCSGSTTIKLEKEIRKGKAYFNVKSFVFEINATKLVMHFDNLFNGDKRLTENFNVFVNANWEIIFNELKPTISKNYGEALRIVANQVFSRIPVNEIA